MRKVRRDHICLLWNLMVNIWCLGTCCVNFHEMIGISKVSNHSFIRRWVSMTLSLEVLILKLWICLVIILVRAFTYLIYAYIFSFFLFLLKIQILGLQFKIFEFLDRFSLIFLLFLFILMVIHLKKFRCTRRIKNGRNLTYITNDSLKRILHIFTSIFQIFMILRLKI